MKVLQLIDSLDAGGAERMAVNLANLLVSHTNGSYLCVTRKEGILKSSIASNVNYLFLERKKTLDISAFSRLVKFIKQEKITHIHAHGTSYFIATYLKLRIKKLQLIWHEHHGKRIEGLKKNYRILVFCSNYFDTIITVNEDLRQWSLKHLKCKQVIYLQNFISSKSFYVSEKDREHGIVCLANLRPPKDHLVLLKAFKEVYERYPDWTLWLIGKDYEDTYATDLKKYVQSAGLEKAILFLGIKENVQHWLQRASIGVLSSKIEGLPMALLEYGAAGLPVAVTHVGYCAHVVNSYGKVVPKGDIASLKEALIDYIEQKEYRVAQGKSFQNHIFTSYSDTAMIKQLLEIYNS